MSIYETSVWVDSNVLLRVSSLCHQHIMMNILDFVIGPMIRIDSSFNLLKILCGEKKIPINTSELRYNGGM